MSKNLKAGIIFLFSLGTFIFFINFLKGKHFFSRGIVLYAVYDNVNGLQPSKAVTISGMKVGKVNSIRFTDDYSGKLLVEMTVNSEFKFDKNTKAIIYEPDFMSGTQIKLEMSSKGTPVKDGDYLIGISRPSIVSGLKDKILPLKDKLEVTLSGIDSTLVVIRKLFNIENRKNISELINDLDQTILSFKKTAGSANEAAENINKLSINAKGLLSENRTKISSVLTGMDTTIDGLNQMVKKLNQAAPDKTIAKLNSSLEGLNDLIKGIKGGKGTLGKLIEDKSMYNQLNQASRELSLLLRDLRENPKRYVHFSIFGKKNKPYRGDSVKDNRKD